MRIVAGGVLGLVLGALVVATLGIVFDSRAYLAVLVAGVVAGVLMRIMAPDGSAYAKGALAALVTALAAIAGPLVATQWFRSQGDVKPLNADKVVVVTEAEDEEGDFDVETDEIATTPVFNASQGVAPLRAPANNPFAVADVACLVFGCLIAYQIAKGPEVVVIDGDEPRAETNPAAEAPPVE
ncbi:hypothetical protein Pla108_32730 [Botrimarina colliarenosi]|uniref:Uncharacterized protein n=1 Tax=Botrimarina colliarenosi TaxID=2528001 RepID=A0A5C6AAL0_9BACT|nr:hypothetical protein [Botrimarina colliarenosi]TWT96185.1 hypothetical protein Pla108_32730 [Botrimarina colliarenosi]